MKANHLLTDKRQTGVARSVFIDKSNFQELEKSLSPGENIESIARGTYADGAGSALLCVTNERVLLVKALSTMEYVENMGYGSITEVDVSRGLLKSTIHVTVPERQLAFTSWDRKRLLAAKLRVQQHILTYPLGHEVQQRGNVREQAVEDKETLGYVVSKKLPDPGRSYSGTLEMRPKTISRLLAFLTGLFAVFTVLTFSSLVFKAARSQTLGVAITALTTMLAFQVSYATRAALLKNADQVWDTLEGYGARDHGSRTAAQTGLETPRTQ